MHHFGPRQVAQIGAQARARQQPRHGILRHIARGPKSLRIRYFCRRSTWCLRGINVTLRPEFSRADHRRVGEVVASNAGFRHSRPARISPSPIRLGRARVDINGKRTAVGRDHVISRWTNMAVKKCSSETTRMPARPPCHNVILAHWLRRARRARG
jgi:hypothetical protein